MAALVCALVVPGAALYGQAAGNGQQETNAPADAGQGESEAPVAPGHVAVGLHVRMLPVRQLSVMPNNTSLNTTYIAGTPYDWNFNTTSQSSMLGYGPAVEVTLTPRMTLSIELIYTRLRYQKVADVYWGVNDPTTAADDRSHMSTTESTQARLWDLPVMLHYQVSRSPGVLSHLYVAAGVTDRLISNISTTSNTTYPNGTSAVSYIAAQTSKRNLLGAVVGVGFRFIDDFNFKVTPEVRYTRWAGQTFGSDSTQSPRDQFEIGVSITR